MISKVIEKAGRQLNHIALVNIRELTELFLININFKEIIYPKKIWKGKFDSCQNRKDKHCIYMHKNFNHKLIMASEMIWKKIYTTWLINSKTWGSHEPESLA